MSKSTPQVNSIYVGWTGEQSQQTGSSWLGQELSRKRTEIPKVEIDATFARTVGLAESQRVNLFLHLEPPSVHTIHIEPLTPGDWEIIELHSSFLEDNLLLQVRALPNPSISLKPSEQARKLYPLTLHLSPTSAANIIVTSLEPLQPASTPFVKVAPGAEVIVAPKLRPKLSTKRGSSDRSMTGTSRKSRGDGSSRIYHRWQIKQGDRKPIFLRAVDQACASEWFEAKDDQKSSDETLKIWVSDEARQPTELNSSEYVQVSFVRPVGLEATISPQDEQSKRDLLSAAEGRPALSIIARIAKWEDAPDSNHAVLSAALSYALGVTGSIGGLVRLCPAPLPVKERVRKLRIFPFTNATTNGPKELRFGGPSRAAQDRAAEVLQRAFGREKGFFDNPLTDGLIINEFSRDPDLQGWHGGIVRFDPSPPKLHGEEKPIPAWYDFSGQNPSIDIQPEIPNLLQHVRPSTLQDFALPATKPRLVGVEDLMRPAYNDLLNDSSVLLTGGLGSGKTSLAQALGHELQTLELFHVSYLSCQSAFSDETRVSSIKEKLNRLFTGAAWATRPAAQSLVIIDDLDRICPAETELQTQENGRSRQIAELLLSIVKQYCGYGAGVVLLATSQSKEALHNLVVSGNIVRDIKHIKAPNKEQRRKLLETLTSGYQNPQVFTNGIAEAQSPGQDLPPSDWLSTSPAPSSSSTCAKISPTGFSLSPSLSLLTIASLTDSYLPGDLALLLSRAKSESLIRSPSPYSPPTLTPIDFVSALKNFTPASLRSVTLHSSPTTFSSIGGLSTPRRILLETLQYPTKYAPLFAQCPLRLRSGILLYGYPGCGKTLLASAIASECNLNFISVKGPEILNKYIGASEKSVRDLFDRAQAAKPCVLFFDEFDSIAPKRGHDSTGVTDRVVNQLLTQMDGAEGLEGVYVLAATSRPDLIDPALLRPGRLDKSLLCGMPREEERRDILGKVAEKFKVHEEEEGQGEEEGIGVLDEVAKMTEGYSGADLQAVMSNAHLEAVHEFLEREEASTKGGQVRKMVN